jgi:hypothetical protein
MPHNGPAVEGVRVTRRSIRAGSCYPAPAGPINCHGARRVWRGFWHPGTNFCEHYACRGTSMIGAAKLSPVTKLVERTGAVSRYKVDRSQVTVKVQDFYCGQVRVSGCRFWQDLSWEQGFAKTMTSLLTLPSV